MTDAADYQREVAKSRLLNDYQKEAFLDHPDELPDDFKLDIINLLSGFDERSQAREEEYIEGLTNAFVAYRAKLQTLPGVPHEERARLLKEADDLENAVHLQLAHR